MFILLLFLYFETSNTGDDTQDRFDNGIPDTTAPERGRKRKIDMSDMMESFIDMQK